MVHGVPGNALCDTSHRLCQATQVIGENFVDTDKLTCRVVPFLVRKCILYGLSKHFNIYKRRPIASVIPLEIIHHGAITF